MKTWIRPFDDKFKRIPVIFCENVKYKFGFSQKKGFDKVAEPTIFYFNDILG